MKFSMVVIAMASLVLASCGTGKKLESANAQIATLNTQVAGLNTQVADLNGKLTDCDKQVGQLKTENLQYAKESEDCRKAKEAIRQKYENVQKNLAEQGTSMKEIYQKAQAAIAKFQDAGADVTYKNGMVHINFQDKFFFKSGSSKVGVKGREALNTVAEVMRDNPKVTTIIVGNTDTLHVKGVADNWSLSTERANAVVRILHETYNIDPSRLTAAGRSKFNPVADNATEAGREKNRRIEIIINPDVSRIWDLMEN